MSTSLAFAPLSQRIHRPLCHLASAVFRPLHLALNIPVAIFLLALTAMLFRPPDLKIVPVDRIAFIALLVVFALRLCIRCEQLQVFSLTWPMLALMALSLWGIVQEDDAQQAWSVFAAKWIVPFALFHISGSIFRDRGSLRRLELFFLAALSYLSFISVLFLFDAKSVIFPQFILDDSIGIHADRARGPMLQAVANGVSLNILGLIALDSYRRKTLHSFWALLLFIAVPLALLATRTRAVWLSAAVSVLLILLFARQRRMRRPAIVLCLISAVAVCAILVSGNDFPRLTDRLQDRSPVDFRLDMYRAGWQMFTEKPLFGWGSEAIIQTDIAKRISSFHPDRYIFHNTFLELAVEHGLLGLGLYAWLMICLLRLAKKPRRHFLGEVDFLDMEFRRVWLVILSVYLLNANAVVMNYQFVNGFLFTLAGILSTQNANCAESLIAHESAA